MQEFKQTLDTKNKRTGLIILSIVVAMIGLAFASVPLYEQFCKITGFGGKAIITEAPVDMKIGKRQIRVKFNTDVSPNLSWDFKPDQKMVDIKTGQQALISFSAMNNGNTPQAGTAVFNVTPLKAGIYFKKTQCFCFDYQMISPNKTAHFPVTFYIDPAFETDKNMEDVEVITLSYSFFKADSAELEKAIEAFYNEGGADLKSIPR